MFSKGKQQKETISVEFDEPLTSDSCSKIITELIKYILYQKQQIPFSCDTLVQLQTRHKPNDKNFHATKTLLSTLDAITDQLTSQLHLTGCDVKEIIVIIGATTISPKFCLRFELPSQILSSKKHLEYQHSHRKPLLSLMRTLVACSEFQKAMSVPLGLTNTFVLVQKSDPNPKSDFFLPRPQYNPLVQSATCFIIKLIHKEDHPTACTCSNLVKVYQDKQIDNNSDVQEEREPCAQEKVAYVWYQSREILKGFKYFR